METLFTPWRYSYISRQMPSGDCFLCAAAESPEAPDGLVVHAEGEFIVLLNKHPYGTGHVMVAPRDHVAEPHESATEARARFWPLVLETQQALRRIYSPDGFNMGINVGRAGGAGVPDHYHFHIVPRWIADTNFMTSIGEVRLAPEDLASAKRKLRRELSRLDSR